jgi:hypothetical protein
MNIINLSELKFADGELTRVQVARVCDNEKHSLYGGITITAEDLKRMKENFEKNARGLAEGDKPILQFDYKHADEDVAAGWIQGLVLSDDGQKLFADVEFTDPARKAIQAKEWKFTSPTIVRNFTNTQTGEKFDIVLKGAALTNKPFLKDMDAITGLSEEDRKKALEYLQKLEEQEDITLGSMENILKAISELTPEEQTEIALKMQSTYGGKRKMSDKDKKMSEQDAPTPSEKEIKLAEENKELREKLRSKELETQFAVLLSEGKAVPAQKDAFLKGDLVEFAKLSGDINLDESGSGDSGKKDEVKTKDAAEEKLNELAEQYAKENEVDYSFALSEVIGDPENAKIVALTEGE